MSNQLIKLWKDEKRLQIIEKITADSILLCPNHSKLKQNLELVYYLTTKASSFLEKNKRNFEEFNNE